MNSATVGQAELFGNDDEGQPPAAAARPAEAVPAHARRVVTGSPNMADPDRRSLVLLVVDCPFCEHQHIHAGGHVGALRLGERDSRCFGRPAGRYDLGVKPS
ncbi:hypothetical protein ABZV24_22355 [Streptomyces sp. NPDC005251]|uniref:hypothetical protein n=1 Tax=Streptomyces sp. NPDC005251 TaxID=3157166 RepID=UPI0033A072DD